MSETMIAPSDVNRRYGAKPPIPAWEPALAEETLPFLKRGMLCLADRNFFRFVLWNKARETGADLLWSAKKNHRLPREKGLDDASYLSTIYGSAKDRRHRRNGVAVRVIEYTLEGVCPTPSPSTGF